MVYGDGRSQLQGDEQSYDIIVSEPSNPWLAGVSNLFTEEFFTTARSRLRPGGVLAQWVQTYNISLSDYLMIVRTMCAVFPYCGLVMLTGGSDTVLLASDRPLIPDAAHLDQMQKFVDTLPDVGQDWRRFFHTTDVRTLLLARYTIDQEILDSLVAKDMLRGSTPTETCCSSSRPHYTYSECCPRHWSPDCGLANCRITGGRLDWVNRSAHRQGVLRFSSRRRSSRWTPNAGNRRSRSYSRRLLRTRTWSRRIACWPKSI